MTKATAVHSCPGERLVHMRYAQKTAIWRASTAGDVSRARSPSEILTLATLLTQTGQCSRAICAIDVDNWHR